MTPTPATAAGTPPAFALRERTLPAGHVPFSAATLSAGPDEPRLDDAGVGGTP